MGFSEKPADFVESRRQPKSYGDIAFHWLTVFLLVFFAVVMITPFIWLLSSSLKTQINIFQYPPQLIPDPIVPENYLYALTYKPFGTILSKHDSRRRPKRYCRCIHIIILRLWISLGCAFPGATSGSAS